jgi:hypothetical protein
MVIRPGLTDLCMLCNYHRHGDEYVGHGIFRDRPHRLLKGQESDTLVTLMPTCVTRLALLYFAVVDIPLAYTFKSCHISNCHAWPFKGRRPEYNFVVRYISIEYTRLSLMFPHAMPPYMCARFFFRGGQPFQGGGGGKICRPHF